jgi:hypothetical protein
VPPFVRRPSTIPPASETAAFFSACHIKAGNVDTNLLLVRPSIFLFALSAIWLESCTSLSPLRPNTAANPNNSVVVENGYKMAFIEFGEQGSYQDPTQLKNAVDLIRVTEKPLVITYVHGGQNNVQSDDVAKFESLLARLNRAPAIRAVGFHLVGVYLGWRGKLTPVPVLKEISFWNRKSDSGAPREQLWLLRCYCFDFGRGTQTWESPKLHSFVRSFVRRSDC